MTKKRIECYSNTEADFKTELLLKDKGHFIKRNGLINKNRTFIKIHTLQMHEVDLKEVDK